MDIDYIDAIYDSLIGESIPSEGDIIVENLFAEGKICGELYDAVYQANRRLCERLSVQEDHDVEAIIDALLTISRELGRKMFIYGTMHQSDE